MDIHCCDWIKRRDIPVSIENSRVWKKTHLACYKYIVNYINIFIQSKTIYQYTILKIIIKTFVNFLIFSEKRRKCNGYAARKLIEIQSHNGCRTKASFQTRRKFPQRNQQDCYLFSDLSFDITSIALFAVFKRERHFLGKK